MLRAVPRADREEFLNVGVVVYCQAAEILGMASHVDPDRLRALGPALDVRSVRAALDFVDGVCSGDSRGGAAATRPIGTRFGFLKAPKSTVLQPGPVHSGLTEDPAAELTRLLDCLVR
ncbi:DUF3037 domain-containing protein [Myroides odoratimimus subsp. xuanwuensis]